MKTFVIAEIGANHDRNIEQTRELMRQCKWAGADAVKFQLYTSETLYAKNTPNFSKYKDINNLIKSIELPTTNGFLSFISNYAYELDIEWFATPFDEYSINTLVKQSVKRLKIAAFESTDPRFVKCCAATKLPLIVSIGINGNAKQTLEWILEENNNALVTILHCNSAYPTPPEDINLDSLYDLDVQMDELNFEYKIGLSDHTESTLTPALAVMLGATVIEKHVTLNKNFVGPDHSFALEIPQFKEMVDNIRFAEKCQGIAEKITPSEQEMINAMRSVVTKCDIKANEVLTEDNITTMRPYIDGSISAKDYYNILGKSLRLDYKAGEIILNEDIFF